MKISISCRITEYSDDKTKSFLPFSSFVNLVSHYKFKGISLRPSVISTQSSNNNIKDVLKTINDKKIKISMVTTNLHLAKNDYLASQNLKNIKPCLDLAEKLNCSRVRIMIQKSEDIYYAQRSLDEANERNIKLLQQTHWGTLAETVEDTVYLIKKIKRKNFGITFEPSNLMACSSKYDEESIKVLLPYIKNFYFQNIILDPFGNHVFKTNRNGNVKVTYTSLNNDRGVPILNLLNSLNKLGYEDWFTIHQPLLPRQTVEEAIKEASILMQPFSSQ
jgi:sugar phosphate isomerase/epimerase